jgi:two-component system, NarL family, invasion response regulator UvrY
MIKKTTVVVVDDHKLFREMWKQFFFHTEIEIIGESGIFDEAVQIIKVKRPDIVLLDINLSQASGFDAMPLIRKFSPGTKVIAISMHNQPVYAKKMIQLGARGYLTKNTSREEVLLGITKVINDEKYICSEIKEIISEDMFSGVDVKPDLNALSLREIEIIKLIQQGFSSKEIGTQLSISVRTVEVHRHNILKKLQIKNTAALINYINTTGLNL